VLCSAPSILRALNGYEYDQIVDSFSVQALLSVKLTARAVADIVQMIVDVGAVKQNDSRIRPENDEDSGSRGNIKVGKTNAASGANEDDNDDDWD